MQLDREGDNTGRVTGCVAKRDGEYTRYKATKGVVLATGDFSQDKDMVAKYCPMALPFGYGGVYDGSGLKLALWIGASWQKYTPKPPCWPRWATKCCPAAGGRKARSPRSPACW